MVGPNGILKQLEELGPIRANVTRDALQQGVEATVRAKILVGIICGTALLASTSGARAADGDHLWSKRLGGEDIEDCRAVATDPWGNVFLGVGSSSYSIDMGGGPLTL